MLTQYHASITRKALKEHFSPRALEAIVAANLKQDNLSGQFGHDEFHFDNNAFEKSYDFIEEQRTRTISSLREMDIHESWTAFGRLTHTAQDFYAHTNYVDLWLARFDEQTPPPPPQIAPLIDELIHNPDLHSGKLYYPWEVLSFIPIVKRFVIPLLPKDSHAHMNLDSPERKERFAYAFEAAVKRTTAEFDSTVKNLYEDQLSTFVNKTP
ncbi:MAG: hypothetical protein PVJ21_14160 [Anaerolineales bacterium]